MTRLYGRKAFLVVDGLKLEGLRMSFAVKKTGRPEPNDAEIVVTNLSRESRTRIQRGSRLVLVAGYESNAAVIFTGDVREVTPKREDTEVDTVIRAGDGDRAYRGAFVSESFAPGASTEDVVRKMASALGVDSARALQRMKEKGVADGGLAQFTQGYAVTDKASSGLTRVLRAAGLAWSIQDGELVILGPKEVSPGQAVLLSPSSGLVNAPELQKKEDKGGPPTVRLTSLLQPAIRPGSALKVEAEYVKGSFRAESVEHKGDTHGDEWFTEVEALPL